MPYPRVCACACLTQPTNSVRVRVSASCTVHATAPINRQDKPPRRQVEPPCLSLRCLRLHHHLRLRRRVLLRSLRLSLCLCLRGAREGETEGHSSSMHQPPSFPGSLRQLATTCRSPPQPAAACRGALIPRPETAAQLARCERSQKQLRQKHLARKMWACVRIASRLRAWRSRAHDTRAREAYGQPAPRGRPPTRSSSRSS